MFGTTERLQEKASAIDTLFRDLHLDHWKSIERDAEPWDLFKETRKFVGRGDNDAAISSLTEIINMPGLEPRQYVQAYYFLNKLVAFSEEYLELYGVAFESRN